VPDKQRARRVTVVTACMRSDGLPHFAVTDVEVTSEQIENGIHYYFAEAELLQNGYEEPFVHFADDERPPFLLPAVQQHIRDGLPETTALAG
jgi:hypothetical protein